MAEAALKRYERLPGTGYRQLVPMVLRGRRVQLWLGDDHLLILDWNGSREYYKRIRYQDIQTIIVHRTTKGKIVNALLGGIVLLLIVFGLGVGDSADIIILMIIAALFGLILLGNFISGPTCRCQLRTAVQTEELHSLTRLPNVRKALDRLRPRITAAQGPLTPKEISQRFQTTDAPPAESPAAQFIVDDPNAPPRIIS